MGERKTQPGVGGEIFNGLQPQFPREGLGHGYRVAIIETEEIEELQVLAGECLPQTPGVERGTLQNDLGQGAGVLRVHIKLALPERLVADQRSTQPELSFNAEARPFQSLGRDFSQQVALRKHLGSDHQGLGVCRKPAQPPHQREQQAQHRASSIADGKHGHVHD